MLSPSCAYRIIDDLESDDRKYWKELKVDGELVEMSEGDFLILL